MIIGYAELTVRGKLMEIRAKPKVLFCTKLFLIITYKKFSLILPTVRKVL